MKQKIKDKKSSEKSRVESELEDIILNNVRQEISTMIGKSKSFYSSFFKFITFFIPPNVVRPFFTEPKTFKSFVSNSTNK